MKSSQFGAMLHISEDNDRMINMIITPGSPTMRHFPEPTQLHLTSIDRINFKQKIQIKNMLTPNTNSQTYGQRAMSHWMSGTIFFVCATSAILVQFAAFRISALLVAQNDVEKDATRNTLRQAFLQRRVQSTQSARFESQSQCRETCRWRFQAE